MTAATFPINVSKDAMADFQTTESLAARFYSGDRSALPAFKAAVLALPEDRPPPSPDEHPLTAKLFLELTTRP